MDHHPDNAGSTSSASVGISGVRLTHISFAVDFFSIMFSAVAAYVLIDNIWSLFGADYERPCRLISEGGPTFVIVSLALSAWFYLNGHHHQRIPFWEAARSVVGGCLFALMAEGFGLYANKADSSRLLTFVTWLLAPVLLMAARVVTRKISHSRGKGLSKVFVVGKGQFGTNAAQMLTSDPHLGFQVLRVIEPFSFETVVDVVLAEPDLAYVVVALSGADELENRIVMALRERNIDLVIVPVPNGLTSGMQVQYLLGEESILLVDKVEVVPRLNRLTKRAFDVIVSSLALALASPVMATVGYLVKQDGGDAFYSHERIGHDGKPFGCLKFRSMAQNSAELLEAYLASSEDARAEWKTGRKLKNDPRVTAFGKFIRKTALDELPQLINVLRGEMSLVGPRPVTQSELDYYGSTVDLYKSVRPGLTGLWQVSGRSDLSYEQRVRLDTWYVRNWTPWHDIAIILKTIPAVLTRRGAY